MKKALLPMVLMVALAVTSCVDNDVYDSNKNTDEPALDLSFSFALKSSKNLSLSAFNGEGNFGKSVLFNVYFEDPRTDEGISHDVEPAYTGYTNDQGLLQVKITLPENVKKLYVYPVTASYGQMQTVDVSESMSLSFHGVAFPGFTDTRSTVHAIDVSQIVHNRIATRYNIFSPFAKDDADSNGVLIPGKSPLVTKEEISTNFINLVNSWYPEKSFQSEELLNLSSDLVVTNNDGAEIWVTYIGDGDFGVGNGCASLLYYNYEAGELTSNADVYKGEMSGGSTNAMGMRMTMIYPNVNSIQCASGIKVQLLYWDKDKGEYSTIFPKDTHVGFVFARSAYKKLSTAIDDAGSYWFAQPVAASITNSHYPNYELFYSTPCLNGKGINKSNAIIRSCPDYDCLVVGMDARYWDDASINNDRDYNDVLFKIVSNPPKGITPEHDIDVDPVSPFDSQHGTLAFEDLWPYRGDYDFNDLVVNYTYKRVKSTSGISEIQLSLKPLARGGTKESGFGIELPFAAGMIRNVIGATLESGNGNATLIIWNNTDDVFGGSGIINTYPSQSHKNIPATEATITLNTFLTDAEVNFVKFNPFIFINGKRGHEIHLVDYEPTSKMDFSMLGMGVDRSDIKKGIYYRMDNTYPWALDIPRISSTSSWSYPAEGEDITEVYLNYEKWTQDKTNYDWFDISVMNGVNKDKLY